MLDNVERKIFQRIDFQRLWIFDLKLILRKFSRFRLDLFQNRQKNGLANFRKVRKWSILMLRFAEKSQMKSENLLD